MNPYESPCDSRKAARDWSLVKRVAWFCLRASLVFAFCLMILSFWQFSRMTRRDRSFTNATQFEKIEAFFTGWNSSPLAP